MRKEKKENSCFSEEKRRQNEKKSKQLCETVKIKKWKREKKHNKKENRKKE